MKNPGSGSLHSHDWMQSQLGSMPAQVGGSGPHEKVPGPPSAGPPITWVHTGMAASH